MVGTTIYSLGNAWQGTVAPEIGSRMAAGSAQARSRNLASRSMAEQVFAYRRMGVNNAPTLGTTGGQVLGAHNKRSGRF